MRRPTRAPLVLAGGSRFAGVSQGAARLVLALLAALIAAALFASSAAAPEAPADGQTDSALYASIVDGVRAGGDYYTVAADAMRGGDYPLRPFFTMRLPTLAVVSASMPAFLLVALLWALAATTGFAWYRRLAPAIPSRAAKLAASLLLLGGMAACLQGALVVFHEAWAGLLIALSLALRRPGRWVEAVAFGLAAALIRETALLYMIVMLAFAVRTRARRETIGWLLAIAMVGIVLGFHAHAVSLVVRPLDPVSPGWTGLLGIGFVAHAVAAATALAILPYALAGPLAVLGLFGWIAQPRHAAVAATLGAYALLLALAARADNLYWVLLVTPLWLVGLLFAIEGVRDLIAAALDSRRITVTRVVR